MGKMLQRSTAGKEAGGLYCDHQRNQENCTFEKEDMKKKKSLKVLKQMDICKEHGAPVIPNSLHYLDSLSERQLIHEVTYLRLTIAPDIRQMRKSRLTE